MPHAADDLGRIRQEIRHLQEQEAAISARLLAAGPGVHEGAYWAAEVSTDLKVPAPGRVATRRLGASGRHAVRIGALPILDRTRPRLSLVEDEDALIDVNDVF